MEKLTLEKFDAMTPTEQAAAWLLHKDVPIKMTPAFVANCIKDAVSPLLARLEALEREVQAREYKGVWDPTITYGKGSFVTSGGSVWFAKAVSQNQKPGTAPDLWQLAVRKGRDGKRSGNE